MKEKIQNWTTKIKSTFISHSAASLALSSTIMATLKYALPSTTYTEAECNKLMTPLFQTILPKMGINRHLALVYRYGPSSCYGLQCNNLYTEQGIAKLQLLLDQAGTTTQCGLLLTSCYEYHSLQHGTSSPLFKLD